MGSLMQSLTAILVIAASLMRVTVLGMNDVFIAPCVAELNLNANQYANFNIKSIPVPTHDDKCMLNCMLQKEGFVTVSGELQLNTLKAKLSAPIFGAINFSMCEAVKTDDVCETVYQMQKCIMDQVPGV